MIKPRRKIQRTNNLRGELTLGQTQSDEKSCIIAPTECYSQYRYFQLKKSFPIIEALIQFILIHCCKLYI